MDADTWGRIDTAQTLQARASDPERPRHERKLNSSLLKQWCAAWRRAGLIVPGFVEKTDKKK